MSDENISQTYKKKKKVCMISSEKVLPYERPALSKGLLMGKAKIPDINTCAANKATHLQEWYDHNGIRTYLDSRVTEIDFDHKTLFVQCHASSGKESSTTTKAIQYAKLLLATGASAVKLSDFKMEGSHLAGIHYLRDYDDGISLLKAIETVQKDGGNVVVIGGGFVAFFFKKKKFIFCYC
ncbi:monodehydroascorbate reductase, partial [Reticulomyxa filosa]